MSEFLHAVKPVIRAIEPYHLKDRDFRIKLNQNESPYDLPRNLKKEILAEFSVLSWNRYPSYTNNKLKEKLAKTLDVDPSQLLIGNGSNELLQILISLVLPPKSKILIVTPTFLIYQQLAEIAEAEIFTLDFDENWQFPVAEILSLLKDKSITLTILCSPNSPTGCFLEESDLAQILEASTGLVLLDEAYYEFTQAQYLKLQGSYENLIVSRTFSKAMGLAGLRIGYFMARTKLIQELSKAKLPYNLNIFSEFVASKLLDQRELLERNVEEIVTEKQKLSVRLQEFQQVTVFQSHANFLMIETPFPSAKVFEELHKRGILVRDISNYHPRLANKLRITIGTPAENQAFISELEAVLAELNKPVS